ncbi:MAG: acyl-CoA thioesterase [Gammaproteobacteria bacterium]|nr:MAG: acyl-CoA thioesterase [Gammaproteobacteria bacterium]
MTTREKLPDDTDLAIRVMATPADTNSFGDIFGGWIMSQVDIAGSIIARRRAQGHVVTVAVNSFLFKHPVFVGDLISCYGKITKVGRTSLTVHVRAFAERLGRQHECIQVTEADVTYVAVDENRRPRPLPDKV